MGRGQRTRLAAGTLAATVLLSWAAPAPSATAGITAEAKAVRLVNQARAEAGRKPLKREARLDEIAERHAIRMRRAGRLFHQTNLAELVPGSWTYAGENVGYHRSVPDLHRAFMASRPHRANILKARFDAIGIGVVRDKSGRVWSTQIFVDRG